MATHFRQAAKQMEDDALKLRKAADAMDPKPTVKRAAKKKPMRSRLQGQVRPS